MKTCGKCKVEKDEAEFWKNNNYKDGLDFRCKSCVREYQQTSAFKAYNMEYMKAYRLRKKAAASLLSSDTQTIGAKE